MAASPTRPRACFSRVRVEDGQVAGQEQVAKVRDATQQRVARRERKREDPQRRDRADPGLRRERHDAGERGESEQRDLLDDRAADRARGDRAGGRSARGATSRAAAAAAAGRPASAWRAGRARRGPPSTPASGPRGGRRAGGTPAAASRPSSVARTVLRSATQATDSTCTGCTAKSAATAAQRQSGRSARAAAGRAERARRVEPEAHQVVGAGVEAEEARVRHVREPGQGVPVGGVEEPERPAQAPSAQPAANHRVLGDDSPGRRG